MELRATLATVALAIALAGCGSQPAHRAVSTPSTSPSASSSVSAAAGRLEPTRYPAALAAAMRTRGFYVRPAGRRSSTVSIAAAVVASHDFRPPGVPTAIHLALVTTPGFGSLDFSSARHASTHLFDRTAAWLVVYDGEEAGQPGTWVVFVNAATGVAQAMVGFGAGLHGGAPCPNNRCIFE